MKTTKDKLEAGNKKRAGRLISTFIRSVAQEKVAEETSEGNVEMITRAEVLARRLWSMALGEVKFLNLKTGSIMLVPPDKDAYHIIIERMEGRVGSFEDEKKKNESIPNKISRKNKTRANKISSSTTKKKSSLKSK